MQILKESFPEFRFPWDAKSFVTRDEGTLLAVLALGQTVLELGSQYGRSTICMAQTAKMVHAVDWHQGDEQAGKTDSLHAFCDNVNKYGCWEKVILHLGRFEDVLPGFQDEYFDLIFIDGLHTAEAVARDIEMVRRLLKPDGTWAFHDYGRDRLPGVKTSVDRLLGPVHKKVNYLGIIHAAGRISTGVV